MKRFNRTLPLLSGLALAGAVAGVSLGYSAVSEINPLYYTAAADRFHGDLGAQRPNWSPPQQAALTVPTAADGLGNGCFGCGGKADYYAAPAIVTYTDSWAADAERAAAPAEDIYVQETAPDPERERVIRYSSYQVSASEAPSEPQTGEAQAEPATEAPASADVTAL